MKIKWEIDDLYDDIFVVSPNDHKYIIVVALGGDKYSLCCLATGQMIENFMTDKNIIKYLNKEQFLPIKLTKERHLD